MLASAHMTYATMASQTGTRATSRWRCQGFSESSRLRRRSTRMGDSKSPFASFSLPSIWKAKSQIVVPYFVWQKTTSTKPSSSASILTIWNIRALPICFDSLTSFSGFSTFASGCNHLLNDPVLVDPFQLMIPESFSHWPFYDFQLMLPQSFFAIDWGGKLWDKPSSDAQGQKKVNLRLKLLVNSHQSLGDVLGMNHYFIRVTWQDIFGKNRITTPHAFPQPRRRSWNMAAASFVF